MKVAVTGAGGLLGKALTSLHLARGDDVRALVRDASRSRGVQSGIRVFEHDLTAAEGECPLGFLDGADVVYHCAAELHDPDRMADANVEGTRRLLKAAAGRIGRWVQVSTVAVYGRPRGGTISEASCLAPHDRYAMTKAGADALVAGLSAEGGFDQVILRSCAVIGPGMQGRFLYRVFGLLNRGLFAPVGAPGALVSLMPVANVVHALQACASLPQAAGRTYILADQLSVERLIEVCCDALGRPVPRWRLPEAPLRAAAWLSERIVPGKLTQAQVDILTSRVRYSTERIRSDLEYNDVMNLEDALRELIAVWQKHKS